MFNKKLIKKIEDSDRINKSYIKQSNDDFKAEIKSILVDETGIRKKFEERIQENSSQEVLRLDKKIDGIVSVIEKSIGDKVKELKLFKASEEMLENNPYGLAIIQELTRRAFIVEEKKYQALNNEVGEERKKIKREYLKLNNVKSFGSISAVELQAKLEKLDSEYHEESRRAVSSSDDSSIKAESIKHTIDFIKGII